MTMRQQNKQNVIVNIHLAERVARRRKMKARKKHRAGNIDRGTISSFPPNHFHRSQLIEPNFVPTIVLPDGNVPAGQQSMAGKVAMKQKEKEVRATQQMEQNRLQDVEAQAEMTAALKDLKGDVSATEALELKTPKRVSGGGRTPHEPRKAGLQTLLGSTGQRRDEILEFFGIDGNLSTRNQNKEIKKKKAEQTAVENMIYPVTVPY